MLNGQYISFKTIVAKLYRDLQLKEEEAFTDILEWCAEALEFIHVELQYESKSECISINNFKGELPCDYIVAEAIEYKGQSILYSSNIFGPQDNSSNVGYLTPYSYNQKKIENVLFVNPERIMYFTKKDSVQIKNGYVKTSFKDGDILLAYKAMIMDEEGYPMIPDNPSFKEALYWYCTYKMLYPKALSGEINAQFYTDAYNKWNWYCSQAGSEAMMPDLITLENIKRSFLSLKPMLNRGFNFYDGLNKNY